MSDLEDLMDEAYNNWVKPRLNNTEPDHPYDAFIAGYIAGMPRWIPVSERLPDHLQKLVMRTEFEELCGEYYMDRFTVQDFDGIYFDAEGVTHWMPLPEQPEQSE